MSYENKYAALARAAEVKPEEEAVAKFMFYAGIKFALKHATNAVPRVEVDFSSIKIPRKLATADPEMLTSSEYQSLKSILQETLHNIQCELENVTIDADHFYFHANEDTVRGREAFEQLNQHRNIQRKLKARKAKLSGIQKKIKALARHN